MRTLTRRDLASKLAVFWAVCLLALLWSSAAFAIDTTNRTAEDIQAKWRELMPVYSGSPYSDSPCLKAPYAAGALNSGFKQDGLNALNYCRWLAGLPDDVTLDSTYTDYAQHGAVLLNVAGFTHTPTKPSSMDATFFNLGYKGTSSSNIGDGDTNLANFTFSCMADSDEENIKMVGHRRWILNPAMEKTGMGYANAMSTTYVFDTSRPTSSNAYQYDSIKWPAAGAFPVEFFDSSTPWSVTLNPSTYSMTAGTSGYKIVMTRVQDGKTWTFTSADTDRGGEYFNFETSRYGVANCLIFRPSPSSVGGYHAGETFDITITGPIKRISDGKAATIHYVTQFVSQDGPTSSLRLYGASSIKVKKSYRLSGMLTPSDLDGSVRISLARYTKGRWHTVAGATVSVSGGSFRYTYKPKYKGKWRATARWGALSTASISSMRSSATKSFSVK